MADRMAEVYKLLVQFGIPEAEAASFVTELPSTSWAAQRRRKKFFAKYREIILAGCAAISGQVDTTPLQGLFS